MKKDLEKKVALIIIDYEEGRLQPTPAGHPQLATLRANPFSTGLNLFLACLSFLEPFQFVLFWSFW